PYLDLLAEAVRRAEPGAEVLHLDFAPGHFRIFNAFIQAGKPDVVHLHWINPLLAPILWSAPERKQRAKVLLLCIDILLVRAHGAKVVWTIHNRLSHESASPQLERRLRRNLCRWVDRIIVHSRSALAIVGSEYQVDLR